MFWAYALGALGSLLVVALLAIVAGESDNSQKHRG